MGSGTPTCRCLDSHARARNRAQRSPLALLSAGMQWFGTPPCNDRRRHHATSRRDERDARPGEHGLDEPIAGGAQPLELGALEGRDVDVTVELALDVGESGPEDTVDVRFDIKIFDPMCPAGPILRQDCRIKQRHRRRPGPDPRAASRSWRERSSQSATQRSSGCFRWRSPASTRAAGVDGRVIRPPVAAG
jgi:hypothetical protein